MRDKLQYKWYFEEYIEEENDNIQFLLVMSNQVSDTPMLGVYKYQIHVIEKHILYAKYSLGIELDLLRNEYIKLAESWLELFDLEGSRPSNNSIVSMLSFAILFNDTSLLVKVREQLNEEEKNDWVLNFYLAEDISNLGSINGTLNNVEYQQPIKDLIVDNCSANGFKEYMEQKWYDDHKQFVWHEMDEGEEEGYFGYWAFEIAAIVKKLGIDDSSLKDVDFYPYDLVHF